MLPVLFGQMKNKLQFTCEDLNEKDGSQQNLSQWGSVCLPLLLNHMWGKHVLFLFPHKSPSLLSAWLVHRMCWGWGVHESFFNHSSNAGPNWVFTHLLNVWNWMHVNLMSAVYLKCRYASQSLFPICWRGQHLVVVSVRQCFMLNLMYVCNEKLAFHRLNIPNVS